MYFTDLEVFVIVLFIVAEFALGLISAYGWLVESDKRKKAEQTTKDMFESEMCFVRSTKISSRDYAQYIKEIEKSIAKERSEKDVYLR